ncbi:MAG: substrate-binding domain-containing protein [Bacillota bacterium]|nr:substrate-binding domain-containing protein [Bacillota bacterium]
MSRRITIGFFVNEIDGDFQTLFWTSIRRAAEKLDINLITFEGRILFNTDNVAAQHNIVYKLADASRLDGLIIATGTIINKVTHDYFNSFIEHYKNIPMVSISEHIPGVPSIIIDNKQGMKSLVNHLVITHKFRRIGFLKGPSNNEEANERFSAYIDVLEENNIPLDEEIIFEGNFQPETGWSASDLILKNQIKIDALVCANDEMAIGAIKYFKSLNLNFKDFFMICGFDNTNNSAIITPSLTTVSQPMDMISEKALLMVLAKINKQEVANIIKLPTVLVVRESCGCESHINKDASVSDFYLRAITNFKVHENLQTFSLDTLYDLITNALQTLNIKSCFIVKYLNGPIEVDSDIPEYSELLYAFYNNSGKKFTDINFKTKLLIPDNYIPENKRFISLIKPLFFNTEQYGFVCFEVDNDDVINFELLRGQISNTLKGALMLLERDQLSEQLREQERMTSLSQLIVSIAHNIKSHIMTIAGTTIALDSLTDEYKKSITDNTVTIDDHYEIAKEMSSWLDKINTNLHLMTNILDQINDQFVKLTTKNTICFSINDLVAGIKNHIRNSEFLDNHIINIDVTANTSIQIKGEIINLLQVIDNILINSVYANLENTADKIDLKIEKLKNFILISIKDYGTGIPESMRSSIFRKMVTTRVKNGTGLGLMLSYSTIKGRFGGDLYFETENLKGTTFYIKLSI